MDFEVSEEIQAMRGMAKNFAERKIRPTMEEDEKEHRFRREIVEDMGRQGFFGCIAPEEFGGNDAGFMGATAMCEEVARVSPSWGLPFNLQMMGMQTVLMNQGTDEQKAAFYPGLVEGKKLGSFAITEPNSGSDVAGMGTTATETDDGFLLNGTKTWISGIPVADVAVTFAYTDKSKKHKGISAFLIEDMHAEGIEQIAIESKLGLYCAPTGEITFQDAFVPKKNLVGQMGDGFKVCMIMLDSTRLSSASRAVGVGQALIEYSVQYANERTQFGQPIGKFQMIQDQIADMYIEHEAAKMLVYRSAWEKDKMWRETGKVFKTTLNTSVAKLYAAEAASHAANLAMKIFGSYGFSTEYPVERYYRDSKTYQVVEGTSNIQKVIIAGFALGYRK